MRKAFAIIALALITIVTALVGGGIGDGELAGHSWKIDTAGVELAGATDVLRGHSWR